MQGEFYLIVVRFAFLPLAKIKVATCCGARYVPWRNTPALHTDRGHSLRALYPPPAALPSLPSVCTAMGSNLTPLCHTAYPIIERDGFAFLRKSHGPANSPPDCLLGRPFRILCPPPPNNKPDLSVWFVWWGRTDSNHRSDTQQIYSLSPLATRELPHI